VVSKNKMSKRNRPEQRKERELSYQQLVPRMIGLTLTTLLLVACGPPAATPTPTPGPPTATPLAKCPVTCSADSEGWSLDFECEEKGQSVETTYHEGCITEFKEEGVYYHCEIDYEFQTSGNVYHAIVDIEPCEESGTGQCITVEATGDTLGNAPVKCQNF